jgi:hypothetical protein
MRDIELCLDALALCKLDDETKHEAQNVVSAHFHSLAKDTPAKTWWTCPDWHPAIGRALRIDRGDEGAPFALLPFRLWHDGERHLVLAAHPAPRCLGPFDWDWLGIETVIAWDPQTDTAFILGDEGPALVGRFETREEGTVFRSPREFFTAWAVDRAQFFARWCATRKGAWAHPAPERDLAPGKLALGDLAKISWVGLPDTIHARGINPATLNKAILRQARLPRAVAQEQRYAA